VSVLHTYYCQGLDANTLSRTQGSGQDSRHHKGVAERGNSIRTALGGWLRYSKPINSGYGAKEGIKRVIRGRSGPESSARGCSDVSRVAGLYTTLVHM
jgi:hypothetical protein